MRIKKYVGATLQEATTAMRKDLGPNALIMGTRRFKKGGLLSFLTKEFFEITAAVDEQEGGNGLRGNSHPPDPRKFQTTYDRATQRVRNSAETDFPPNIEELKHVAEQFSARRHSALAQRPHSSVRANGVPDRQYTLESKVEVIEETLREISDHLKYSKMPVLPDPLRTIYENLIAQDVDEKLAGDIVQRVYGRLSEEQYAARTLVEGHIIQEMTSMIAGLDTAKRNTRRKSKIVALVGPTGVGKTTTIAKLASIQKLMEHQNVGLISVDTYRIGAIEQLRTFAAIADIQMEVVYKPTEMQTALRKLRGKDVIFIDTVGRSQRVKKELTELRRFVAAANPDEVHLVMSASTNLRTMFDVVSKFMTMEPNRLIFSKLDEAVAFGPLLSVTNRCRIPVSYATTGQDVPDDIIAIDARQFATMVYTGVIPNGYQKS